MSYHGGPGWSRVLLGTVLIQELVEVAGAHLVTDLYVRQNQTQPGTKLVTRYKFWELLFWPKRLKVRKSMLKYTL